MRMPLLWLNLILATILGLIFYQPALFIPEKPADYVLIAPGPLADERYKDVIDGADMFERDWRKRVTVLEGSDDSRELAQTLKYAISLNPHGISMPGSDDHEVLMPFVVESQRRGIPISFHSTPLEPATRQFGYRGTGYVGTNSETDGALFIKHALNRLAPDNPNVPVLIVGPDADIQSGTRLNGCFQAAEAYGATVDYLRYSNAEDQQTASQESLRERLSRAPLPAVIVWDAGPVHPLTSQLELLGLEPGSTSVVTFSVTMGLPLGQQFFLRMQNDDKTTIATYMSLVQLFISDKYGIAGMNIPLAATL